MSWVHLKFDGCLDLSLESFPPEPVPEAPFKTTSDEQVPDEVADVQFAVTATSAEANSAPVVEESISEQMVEEQKPPQLNEEPQQTPVPDVVLEKPKAENVPDEPKDESSTGEAADMNAAVGEVVNETVASVIEAANPEAVADTNSELQSLANANASDEHAESSTDALPDASNKTSAIATLQNE